MIDKIVLAIAAIHFVSVGALVVKVNSTEPFAISPADIVYFGVKMLTLSNAPVPLDVHFPLEALPPITAFNCTTVAVLPQIGVNAIMAAMAGSVHSHGVIVTTTGTPPL